MYTATPRGVCSRMITFDIVDGKITDDEREDFERIQDQLEQITIAVDSLKLWVSQAIADGKMK